MADRTLSVKLSGALTDGANAMVQNADGLYVPSPAAAGLSVQPASPLAVMTVPCAHGASNGFWSLPPNPAYNTANASPNTITVSTCQVLPFMVETQKTVYAINFRMTAINGGTGTTPCQLYFGLHRIDLDTMVTTLVKDLGNYSATSSGTLGYVPNASGTVLSPGIVYALAFNPGYTTAGGQITTYAVPGSNYISPLPVYCYNDPPQVADWATSKYYQSAISLPTNTNVLTSLDLKTSTSTASSPLYYLTFAS